MDIVKVQTENVSGNVPENVTCQAFHKGGETVTIKDIARESGYAISTVSRALNNHPDVSAEARERIQAVVKAHQFVPNNNARQLKQQQSQSILLVVKGTSNPFLANMMEQMQSAASDAGYSAQCHYLDEDANEVLVAAQLCRERKPLGIIFLGGSAENFEQGFDEVGVPCVLATAVNRKLEEQGLSMVGIDDAAAAHRAIDHLCRRGHRTIAVVGGDNCHSYISSERLRGCKESFAAHHLAPDEALYAKANYNYASAYRAMDKLLSRRKDITAVFCMSDIMAVGAIRAIRDAGLRVPEDISVMGFDGIDLAKYYDPKITTVCQPVGEIARTSVDLLLARIEKEAAPKTVVLGVKLSEGDSVRQL